MSQTYNQMITLERQVKSLRKKFDAAEQESTLRGIELTRLRSLVEKAPMPGNTRELLREPLRSYVERCGQKGKGEN